MSTPMRQAWDRFAREDARFFILTNPHSASEADFYAQGRETWDAVRGWIESVAPGRLKSGAALDIGCGIGRVTRALADSFDAATGVDVSAEMVKKARAAHPQGKPGFEVVSGSDLSPVANSSMDFVHSAIVFQHIPDWAAIENYIREVGRVLRPGALAARHLDTRRLSLPAKVYRTLPDFLLPRHHRRFVRRVPRDSALVRSAFEASGLRIIAEQSPDSDLHWFLVEKPDHSQTSAS